MSQDLRERLRTTYNRQADARNEMHVQHWKVREREQYLALVQAHEVRALLDVGAGPGIDSLFFHSAGLTVTSIDLSPEMVRLCTEKGLQASVMDVADLQFATHTFDAVYSVNCLLHIPKKEFAAALGGIANVLKPKGLFYLGMYGGYDFEDVWAEDAYDPKRFFSFFTDQALLDVVSPQFEVLNFDKITVNDNDERLHFQALTLQNH